MLIKPGRLRVGDTVAIVAPASAPPEPESIDRSVEAIETLGFKPRLAPNVRKRKGFLAGTDRERAADLLKMFAAPEVRAILCLRGGYGTSRLIPWLDFTTLRRNPKIFMGYSDITSLHCALLTQANLISFHGPMLNSDFIRKDFPDFTLRGFLRTLTEAGPAGSIRQGYPDKTVSVLRRGKASGRLLGGNLSLVCATIGTPFQPSFRNKILFLEDLEEPPYRFDRMLTHLLNAGLLQQVAGIAIGINRNCIDPNAATAREYRQTVEDVLAERLLPLKIPIVTGLPFGHVPLNATLPIGARATLDGIKGDLIIEETAVR
jgi:muramoyltetrapeptide carboxypeptidase